MKLIKRLLDKLHQLIEKLHTAVTKLEEDNEVVRQDKLYKLRLDRGLSMLGIPQNKRGPGHLRFANFVYGNVPREKALRQTLEVEAVNMSGEANKRFDGVRTKSASVNVEKAYKEAMKVKLPTLKEKAKVKFKSVSNGTKRTYNKVLERIVEKTNGKGRVVKNAFFALLRLLFVLAVVALFIWALVSAYSFFKNKNQADNNPTQTETSQTETPKAEVRCPAPGWEFIEHKEDKSNPATQRWFIDGVLAIQKGQAPAEGLKEWIEKSKQFRMTYAIMRELAFNKNLAKDQTVYFNDILSSKLDYSNIPENGNCATDENIEEMSRLEAAYASFEVFGPDDPRAPKDWEKKWFNSYFSDNLFAQPSVGGTNDPLAPDDKSVIFVMRPDGFIFAIRGICGNVQTERHHDKHHDHDRDKDHKDRDRDKDNEKVKPKNPKDDPAVKGNAPKGGRENEDPGPGKYTAPSETTKPSSEPRVNPDPPTSPSSSTSSSNIPKGSEPDSVPAPAPEKAAPAPDKPATGTVTVPGM